MKCADDIYLKARELADPAERSQFLTEACGADAQLLERVAAMLDAAGAAEAFFDGAGSRISRALTSPMTEAPGTVIGRYKLFEKIGEGGCGVVYVAEQAEPVRRRVALKVIKLGMDTRQVVARFEAERQALALMDHANIAKVLDAGATETGRPYFVMELVRGLKITEFCDQNQLPTQERLKLFIEVCRAVQHAHQKGIIHRDLKPSNILVTVNDGVPVPKVIDFGIAKATQGELTDKTVYTQFQQLIGTPAYMSPEQAEMTSVDIDTRTDIYGLGVLLYELLTGRTPFEAKELVEAGLDEMRRTIREREPLRPSTRLNTLVDAELRTTAKARQTEPPKLLHLVRGDLDWIVMKCLEKDRAHRYDTANGLAMDLQRHLDNEPVVARPPSATYRFQKLVRRNKLTVGAVAAVAVALSLGTVVSSWQAVRASRAEGTQIALRRQADESARKAGAAQAAEAQQRRQAESEAYASDINLAQRALAEDNFGLARKLLEKYRQQGKSESRKQGAETGNPEAERDLRGWEWRYLWQQCTNDACLKLAQKPNYAMSLAVSQDDKWLAIGELDDRGAVSVLDISSLTTPREVASFPAGVGVYVTFSPKEPLLAFSGTTGRRTGNEHTSVRVWNVETKQTLLELSLSSMCAGLAFAPDGRTLAAAAFNPSSDADGQVILWRVDEGKVLTSYALSVPASETAHNVTFAPDLSAVAVGGDGLRVIDLSTGKVRWSATNDHAECRSLVFSRDAAILITAEGSSAPALRLWDARSGKQITSQVTGHRHLLESLVVWPDNKTLASSSIDGTIRLWDISDPNRVRSRGRPWRGQFSGITSLGWLPRRRLLLSGGLDGSIYAWETARARNQLAPVVIPGVIDYQFSSDSQSLLTLDARGQVRRWQAPDFQVNRAVLEVGSRSYQTDFSDDGSFLVSVSNRVVRVWDLSRRSPARQLPYDGLLAGGANLVHAFVPGTNQLMAWEPAKGLLHQWDLNAFQERKSWTVPVDMNAVAMSAGGQWNFAATYAGEAFLREVATDHCAHWNLGTSRVVDANFSADGKLFAVSSYLGLVRVWDTLSRRPVVTVGTLQAPIYSASFSPDGHHLLTTSGGTEAVTIWDLRSQRALLRLEGSGSGFLLPRFSRDGRFLACWSPAQALYVWSAPSLAEIDSELN